MTASHKMKIAVAFESDKFTTTAITPSPDKVSFREMVFDIHTSAVEAKIASVYEQQSLFTVWALILGDHYPPPFRT